MTFVRRVRVINSPNLSWPARVVAKEQPFTNGLKNASWERSSAENSIKVLSSDEHSIYPAVSVIPNFIILNFFILSSRKRGSALLLAEKLRECSICAA